MSPNDLSLSKSPVSDDAARLILRGSLALVFVYHGAQKLFGWFGGYGIDGTAGFFESLGIPFPTANVIAVGSLEFFGGILLAVGVGVLTRYIAAGLTGAMLVASVTAHWGAFNAAAGGMEFPLTLAFVSAALALLGPGRYSLLGAKSPVAVEQPQLGVTETQSLA